MDKWKKDYFVPNFGVDHDIGDSNTNLKNTEGKLGTWTIPPKPKSLAELEK